jgi:uncharacterized protein YecE (DUF72 family)
MIMIGTSGWVYPHWEGHFYPRELPARDLLRFYARHFPTVELNRSYYRLPTHAQFAAWAAQVGDDPGFIFAVKASRYLTHMKKLREPREPIARLVEAAEGLGSHLGPFLYQLPPHWRADASRLGEFLAALPKGRRAAFEFRDASWYRSDILRLVEAAGVALVEVVGGVLPTPPSVPPIGPFRYVRFHNGARGIGVDEDELRPWADRLANDAARGRDAYLYFNNDPDGHAVVDAERLMALLGPLAARPLGAASPEVPGHAGSEASRPPA